METIKSYFEDIEREPPLSTGSIFATGFSSETSGGFGGAPTQSALVELLGLGTGDLTVGALRSLGFDERPVVRSARWQVAGRAFMDG